MSQPQTSLYVSEITVRLDALKSDPSSVSRLTSIEQYDSMVDAIARNDVAVAQILANAEGLRTTEASLRAELLLQAGFSGELWPILYSALDGRTIVGEEQTSSWVERAYLGAPFRIFVEILDIAEEKMRANRQVSWFNEIKDHPKSPDHETALKAAIERAMTKVARDQQQPL